MKSTVRFNPTMKPNLYVQHCLQMRAHNYSRAQAERESAAAQYGCDKWPNRFPISGGICEHWPESVKNIITARVRTAQDWTDAALTAHRAQGRRDHTFRALLANLDSLTGLCA